MKKLTAGDPVERRERRSVSMRGFAVRADGETIEIMLLDLSYDGCGIETLTKLHRDEALRLSVLNRCAIDAHVRWCKGGKAGLSFDIEAEEPVKREVPRASSRVPLTAEVTMRRLGHANFRVRVFDFSPRGCKVELIERPNDREHVLVKFDGLEISRSRSLLDHAQNGRPELRTADPPGGVRPACGAAQGLTRGAEVAKVGSETCAQARANARGEVAARANVRECSQ